jgi:hypothetical protein
MENKPKILFLDIETAPILAYCWGLWDQTISLGQIKKDWHVLAWCAKWADSKKLIYRDQRNVKNIENDKDLLKGIWDLLNEADIVVTQNGKQFDVKKLNARFAMHNFAPPSTFKHIDTKLLAVKNFGFTSNKLEYLTDKLCVNYKKLTHKKFPGFELWKECLAGNKSAWSEMEKYNKYDVLSLEELYKKLIPWGSPVNFSAYSGESICSCGSKEFKRNGHSYTSTGKYQRFACTKCGSEVRSGQNLNAASSKLLRPTSR